MFPRSAVWRAMRAALVLATLTVTGHSIARDRELTESPDFRVRVQAALRLGRSGGADARADLEEGLKDAHPAVRVASAAALGNLGEAQSIPALERAMRSETYPTAKTAIKETIDKLRANSAAKANSAAVAADPQAALAGAQYVVQLGNMHNNSGVRADDLDTIMRQAARTKANMIKGAVVLETSDPAVVKRASDRKIPILQLDGTLTQLSHRNTTDGTMIISARVDMSIRKLPQQTLKATVSGNASASNGTRPSAQSIQEMQNRVVGGAVESAINSVGAEIVALTK